MKKGFVEVSRVMKKEDFIELYYTCTLAELSKRLNCSVPTIYKRIDEYGIEKKGQGKGHRAYKKLILE